MGIPLKDLSPDTPIGKIEGASLPGKTKEGLDKLGLHNIGDLLEHYPRRYEDRTKFDHFPDHPMEDPVCIHGVVTDAAARFVKGRGRGFFEATVEPPEGSILGQKLSCRWFNMPFMKRHIVVGQELVLYGRPKISGRRLVVDHPDYEILNDESGDIEAHMGRIVPIYGLASGVNQKWLRSLIFHILESVTNEELSAILPDAIAISPTERASAVRSVHFPPDHDSIEPSRRYLALEEFTRQQLVLLEKRKDRDARGGKARCGEGRLLDSFLNNLPFSPTAAQLRVISEIREDLAAERSMIRLLQGDVGAGKTLVAAAAILLVTEAGYDAALMAPTQILAEQHFRNFSNWFEPLGVSVKLRTGTKQAGGDMPLFDAAGGGSFAGSLLVGTHALIHGDNSFERELGLAVIDEQHKFGVGQREALIAQGNAPDVLVMTATPIPRTLTLSFYGDLDVSILDEIPPGRGKIITGIRLTSQTKDAARFVADQVAEGRQAYIVYPLIEESEKVSGGAATVEFETWQKLLPESRLVLLHGRLTPDEKDEVMETFRSGKADVLVSTTVIEVGVDVPNANIMLIYHADRFGLAQLHQLRGRIGRGEHKSYCILMCAPENTEGKERLSVLVETSDGFRIAEEDLRQRGPGEVLGTQQSGLPDFAFAEYLGDTRLVEQARASAIAILEKREAT